MVLLLGTAPPLAAWGAKGHEIVASLACRDLPPELAPWFRGREAVLREHCNDPDQRRRGDPLEGPRHYLDSEAYGGPAGVPRDMGEALARLGRPVFARSGQAPWVVQERVRSLAEAFRARDPARALLEAACLCHDVGDLNVPLHSTADYDGQFEGQPGAHRRWESGLVERLGSWDPEPRVAVLDDQAWWAPWAWLREANGLVATLLLDDRESLRPGPPADPWEGVGSEYWAEFGRRQGPVVRARLEVAGRRAAQMILLAWRMAGEPGAG
jgi:hypothetical protein